MKGFEIISFRDIDQQLICQASLGLRLQILLAHVLCTSLERSKMTVQGSNKKYSLRYFAPMLSNTLYIYPR